MQTQKNDVNCLYRLIKDFSMSTTPTPAAAGSDTSPSVTPAATKTAAKTATKTAVKTVAKAAAKTPVKTPAKKIVAAAVNVAPATSPEKSSKPKKPKMVRDSFSFPKAEYVILQELKERSHRLTQPAKKTELLRAAIKTLSTLDDAAFLKAIQSVPSLKTGRPAKSKAE
jgi:hypothetical protein